jgi:hypothetical protein
MVPSASPHPPKRRGRPKKFGTSPVDLFVIRAPFRAEVLKEKIFGEWRDHIEQAMGDARKLGSGARVISKSGVVLAKFENAVRYATPHYRERPNQRTP